MAADFTRFDFHAKKFYFSENVQVMSAEEVGQYLLLMVAAWLGGKDASLPDNPMLLARIARVDKISELVLSQFPLIQTEHGERRRNETLYEEWQAAVDRSGIAKKKADARWGNEDSIAAALQQHCSSNPQSDSSQVKSIQAGFGSARPDPSQPKSVQASQPRTTVLICDRGAAAPDPAEIQEQEQKQEPDFRLFRHLFNNKNKILNVGNDKSSVAKYHEMCNKYGTARVHAALDSWATDKTIAWIRDSNIRSTFGLFVSQLDKTIERMADDKTVDVAMIEADAIAEKIPSALATKEALVEVDEVILRVTAEEERRRVERAKKFSPLENDSTIDPEKFLE